MGYERGSEGVSGAPTPPRPGRLLDEVRRCLRLKHYSLRTEQAYIGWIRRFILANGKRHPRDMGRSEVERYGSEAEPCRYLQPSLEPVQPPDLVLCLICALLSAFLCRASRPYLLNSFSALFSAAFLSLTCCSRPSRLPAISVEPLSAASTDQA